MRVLAACVTALTLAACTSAAPERRSTPASTTAARGTSSGSDPTSSHPADWPTYHGDAQRSGVSTTMPAAQATPKVTRRVDLDAAVYASPIVAGGVVVVATENNSVYGLTPAGGIRWHRNLGAPARGGDLPCGNIDPSGITGTPVYSPDTGLVYAVAEHAGPIRHELVALVLQTGDVRWRRNLPLPGTAQDAMQQRGALNLAGHRVWVAFGGRLGDCGNYKGTVVGVPDGGDGADVSYVVPTRREAGIWTPPGPVIDENERIYLAVGNGAAGVGDAYDLSDSVLELDLNARLLSSFSPSSWAKDNEADLDLGSQGPALVGRWVLQIGKSGTAYVLRRDALGGIGGQVSSTEAACRSFGGTAVLESVVYVPCTDGVRAVRISASGRVYPVWRASSAITGSPVVGGGRVWSLDVDAGALHALDPSTGKSLGSVPTGAVSRFATPAIYGRTLLVGTMSGLDVIATS